jgi:uridylate kinase
MHYLAHIAASQTTMREAYLHEGESNENFTIEIGILNNVLNATLLYSLIANTTYISQIAVILIFDANVT